MTNKPDSTAADIADILKRRGALHIIQGHNFYTEESVISAMTEFATIEAQQFAEFIHKNARISAYFPNIWDCVTDGKEYTHADLYNGPYAKWKEERGK